MSIPVKSSLVLFAFASTLVASRIAPNFLLFQSTWKTGSALSALLLTAYFIWTVLLYPLFFTPLRRLPQPPGGSLIIGHGRRIFKEATGAPHREWLKTVPNDGLIYYRSFFNSGRVIPTSTEALREILSQKSYEFVKPPQLMQGIGQILGYGVLLAEGDEHKLQRKNLAPAFTFRHVKDLYGIFWATTRDMILAIDKELQSRPSEGENEKTNNVVEASAWMSRATLDIIGMATMGKSFNALEDEHNALYQTYKKVLSPSGTARFLGFLGLFLPFWLVRLIPIKRNQDIQHAPNVIKGVCREMIREKKAGLAEGKNTGVDILSVALSSGGFTDEGLVDQLMTFLAAGHETTASAMSWATYYLCKHPKVQARLRSELVSSLPSIRDPTSNVTATQLDALPYLGAVCSEVLRFQPPVPFTMRQAKNDETILGQHIPKDTTIILAPAAINTNPAFWGPDADEFNPDRWLGPGRSNTGGAKSNYAFLTFLHGPRSCIGQGFSRAEFASLLAGWIMAYEMELEDNEKELEIVGGLTQRPKGGVKVVLKILEN